MRRVRDASPADSLVVAVLALIGLRLGLAPLRDNSAFTHLATGIRMVAQGWVPAIPRVDPYSFTARGHEWVVQSWLPEAAVGWVYRVVGENGVTVVSGLAFALSAWLVASLARTGHPLRSAAAATCALSVGVGFWAPRPLMVGLICLALTILIVDRGASSWLLVPIVWVWVNSHGSFPLGLAWLALVLAGSWIDRRSISWGYLVGFVAGLAAAVVNPLGPRVLTFPFTALRKRAVFSHVAEWQRPDFGEPGAALALIGIVVALVLLVRAPKVWRDLLPVVGFVGLGLTAQRNLVPLGVVLAPALARALRTDAQPRLSLRPDRHRIVVAGLAAAALVLSVVALRPPLVNASGMPVQAIVWLEERDRFDGPHRVVTVDRVANFLELRHGARSEVFIDDRFDMFPLGVTRDYIAMRAASDRGERALDRWRVDTVLWPEHHAFAKRLVASGGWAVAVRRAAWVVLIRRTD